MVLYDGPPAQQHDLTKASVVIIGAGFSGICTAIKLIEAGIKDFVILEKGAGFGGTWKDNVYPGCCCDVFSHLYSFSFAQNPDWSRAYPAQDEILNYIRDVVRKYDLYRYVRFSSAVTAAKWNDASARWEVDVQVLAGKEAEFCDAYTIDTSFLIAGVGQLNAPYRPVLPGDGAFQGKVMHSARWDWSYDLKGKRIGIIGNGATAVQVVPEVAKVASKLTIFQRTPNWVIPRLDADVPKWQRSIFRNVPFALSRVRSVLMDEREAYHQALVQRTSNDSAAMTDFCREYVKTQLPDHPHLWEKLTPDYPPGCKRIIISDDYYPTLCLPNVSLETRRIRTITEDGIAVGGDASDEEGEAIDLDLIVYATGFQTNDFMHGIDVQGLGGRSLRDIWKNGASALYGVTVEGLPNFGMLYGPNTNLGHNSIILMIESQARYLTTLIKEVLRSSQGERGVSITPKTQRVKDWNLQLQENLALSSFADPRCNSWYKTDDGLVTNNWSGTVVEYQKIMARVDWGDYDIEGKDAEASPQHTTYIGRVVEETIVSSRTLVTGAFLGALAAAGVVYRRKGLAVLKDIL